MDPNEARHIAWLFFAQLTTSPHSVAAMHQIAEYFDI
jgi:hypothetical protein